MAIYKGNITLINVNDGEDGQSGLGIKKTTVYYAISNNGSAPPELQDQDLITRNGILSFSKDETTFKVENNKLYAYLNNDYIPLKIEESIVTGLNNWSTTIPQVPIGFYLWVKTVTIYTDNTATIAYSVSRVGEDGQNGVSIISVRQLYLLTSSSINTPLTPDKDENLNWSDLNPEWDDALSQYLWICTEICYSNGEIQYTTPYTDSNWKTAVNALALIDGELQNLQNQIDGAISTWYDEGEPSLDNLPWNDGNNEAHIGDLYYNKNNGQAYRFYGENGVYSWELIRDTEFTKALGDLEEVREIADSKVTIYYSDILQNAIAANKVEIDDLLIIANGNFYKCVENNGEKEWQLANVGIDSFVIEYAQNQSNTVPPTEDSEEWKTVSPEWKEGWYIWQRTVTKYKEGSKESEISEPICISAAAAKGIVLAGEQVFKSSDGENFLPETITLNTTIQGDLEIEGWYYKKNDSWISLNSKATQLTFTPNSNVFVDNDTVATIKVKTTEESYYDVMSIYKVSDGKNGSNGESVSQVFLTNENITFAANALGQIAEKRIICEVRGYTGSKEVLVRFNSPSNIPEGMHITARRGSYIPDGEGVLPSYLEIKVDANATLGSDKEISGAIAVTITSPISTTLYINWSKVNSGADGKNGITYYTWIKYSNVGNPQLSSDISDDPTDKSYIGFAYNQTSSVESNDPKDYKWSLIKGQNGDNGITYYTWIKYADSPTEGITDNPEGKKYIGIAYNKTEKTESLDYNDYSWSLIKGENGQNGTNGETYYTWIRYADDENGTNMDDDPTEKKYIGMAYNQKTPNESDNPKDYSWALFRGSDGIDAVTFVVGSNSITIACSSEGYTLQETQVTIPFTVLQNGKKLPCQVRLLEDLNSQIKFEFTQGTATSEGNIYLTIPENYNFNNKNDETVKFEIIAVDSNNATYSSSHNFTYTKNYAGADGINGDSNYTHIKYSNDGLTFSDNLLSTDITDWKLGRPTGDGNSTSTTDATRYLSYGKTIDVSPGQILYFDCGEHKRISPFIFYKQDYTELSIDYPQPPKIITVPQDAYYLRIAISGFDGLEEFTEAFQTGVLIPSLIKMEDFGNTSGDWLGIHISAEEEPPKEFNLYSWTKIRGQDGGDGITYYTWIKYADDDKGTNMTDLPEGKEYLGLAYNKLVQTESSDPNDYSWSLIKGANGQPGTTYYTWIRYADDENGTNMNDDPTEKKYIGIAYNKTTPNESDNPKDYSWALFRGSNGVSGENGKDANLFSIRFNQSEILKFVDEKEEVTISPSTLTVSIFKNDSLLPDGAEQIKELDISNFSAEIYNLNSGEWHSISESDIILDSVGIFNIKLQELANKGKEEGNLAANILLHKECILRITYRLSLKNDKEETENFKITDYLNVRYGMNKDMASLSINAGNIVASMQDSKLVFGADGLTIQNGSFKIEETNAQGEKTPLLYLNKETGNLALNGDIYAENGYFKGSLEGATGSFKGKLEAATGTFAGSLEAASGTFSGDISAASGTIGGFIIESGRLKSTGLNENNLPNIILNGKDGTIEAENITLGTGANIKEYIKIGSNVELRKPISSNDSFIRVLMDDKTEILTLKANGVVNIGNGNNTIILSGEEGSIMSQNYLDGLGWKISNTESVFNDVTVKGSIRASVLEYGETQAIGGTLMVRPSSRILKAILSGQDTILTLEEIKGFNIGDYCRVDIQFSSGLSHNFYKIVAINQGNKTITVSGNATNTQGKPIVNFGQEEDNVGICINGSTDYSFSTPQSISVFDFNPETKIVTPRIVLGKLPNEESIYGYAAGTYGLYAENVLLKGSLVTQTNTTGSITYSGISTLYSGVDAPTSHKYTEWFGEDNVGEILLWAGATGTTKEEVENSRFFVDRNGNLFAGSGYFRGTIITDATITASQIETAVLRGSNEKPGEPALRIEDAAQGIVFTTNNEQGKPEVVFKVTKDMIEANVPNFKFNSNFTVGGNGSLVVPKLYVIGDEESKVIAEDEDTTDAIIFDNSRIAYTKEFKPNELIGITKGFIDFSNGVVFSPDGTNQVLALDTQEIKAAVPLYIQDSIKYNEVMEYKQAFDKDGILIGYDLYIE